MGGMQFNLDKCKIMHVWVGPTQIYSTPWLDTYRYLEEINEEMDIGVKISSNLKPSIQCSA